MKNVMSVLCALAPAVMLVGCIDAHPAVTSDDVLAAQYSARAPREALTGPEATIITDTYHRQIGVAPTVAADPAAGR